QADSTQADARRPGTTAPGVGEPFVARRDTTEQATAAYGPDGGPATDEAQRPGIQPPTERGTTEGAATGHGAPGAAHGARSADDDTGHGARGRAAAVRAAQADASATGAPTGGTDGAPGATPGTPAGSEPQSPGTDLVPPAAARAEQPAASAAGDDTAPGAGSRSVPGADGPPGGPVAATDTATPHAPT
ncbi:hypothetical protein H8N01_00095, partial [Streptomyces sp. AC536]|nr:hypothetical protein [Streptomyces buecherae]